MYYRSKTSGAILRAEVTSRKVAVYYDYPEHCGQPSWLTRSEFRAEFDRVMPCAQVEREVCKNSCHLTTIGEQP